MATKKERSKAASVLGAKGGKARTERKAESARANGKLGGRPAGCGCGEITGVPCDGTARRDEMVTVEWMPEHLRASHEAAGNSGVYPHNGAIRVQVMPACAESILESEPDWAELV